MSTEGGEGGTGDTMITFSEILDEVTKSGEGGGVGGSFVTTAFFLDGEGGGEVIDPPIVC